MKNFKWLGVVLCLFIISPVFAISSKDKLWQKISETNIPQSSGERRIIPDKYGTFLLNVSSLHSEFVNLKAKYHFPILMDRTSDFRSRIRQ